jgi:hypothetical protein
VWVAACSSGAERQAVELSAKNAKLETFERSTATGYEEYARIVDYAPGFYLASMKKSLARYALIQACLGAGHQQTFACATRFPI